MQLKIIIGLVIAMALMGWGLKYQTEQLGASRLALQTSEATVKELTETKARLDQALAENAKENDRINSELTTAHSEWGRLRDELSKTDKCINADMPAAVIDWMRGDNQQGDKGHATQ